MTKTMTNLDIEIEDLKWAAQEDIDEEVDIVKEDLADAICELREEMNATIRDLKKESAERLKVDIAELKAEYEV